MMYAISMLLSASPSVAEGIINVLSEGSLDSLSLLKRVQEKHPVTKQGFYRALRVLLKEEIVTKNKQIILLSPIWVSRLNGLTEKINQTSTRKDSEKLLNLSEGDTMTFKFKSVTDLYFLWNHYFFIFCKNTDTPILFFNSHNFWALFRSDIENEMYAWIKGNGKKAYSVIGYTTRLDRETSDYLHKDYGIEIAYEGKPSVKENVFPAVFGDYVMSTVLDMEAVHEINTLYEKYSTWEPAVQSELETIISKIKRSKVVIERNEKKAEQLRVKLMNHFLFYKTPHNTKK